MPRNPFDEDAFGELAGNCQHCVNQVAEAIFEFTDPVQEWQEWQRMHEIDRDRQLKQIKEVAKESLARIRLTVDEAIDFERKHADWCLETGDHSSEPFSESREERLIVPFETVRKLREMSAAIDSVHRIRQDFREGRANFLLQLKRPPTPPEGDGPVAPDAFCYNDEVVHGLTAKPFKLVEYLWRQRNRTSHFANLAEPVWDDREAVLGKSTVGSIRREANKFFKTHTIPYKVRISGSFVQLIDHSWPCL